jgi:hypothetical protein
MRGVELWFHPVDKKYIISREVEKRYDSPAKKTHYNNIKLPWCRFYFEIQKKLDVLLRSSRMAHGIHPPRGQAVPDSHTNARIPAGHSRSFGSPARNEIMVCQYR